MDVDWENFQKYLYGYKKEDIDNWKNYFCSLSEDKRQELYNYLKKGNFEEYSYQQKKMEIDLEKEPAPLNNYETQEEKRLEESRPDHPIKNGLKLLAKLKKNVSGLGYLWIPPRIEIETLSERQILKARWTQKVQIDKPEKYIRYSIKKLKVYEPKPLEETLPPGAKLIPRTVKNPKMRPSYIIKYRDGNKVPVSYLSHLVDRDRHDAIRRERLRTEYGVDLGEDDLPINPTNINLEALVEMGGWEKKETQPNIKLLKKFARLYKESDEEILKFAGKYGPLWLCSTDKHNFCFWKPPLTKLAEGKKTDEPCSWYPLEPIEAFRFYSRQVRAASKIWETLTSDECSFRRYVRNNVDRVYQLWQEYVPDIIPPKAMRETNNTMRQIYDGKKEWFFSLSLKKQRSIFAGHLTRNVLKHVSHYVFWDDVIPQKCTYTGLGFFPLVWAMLSNKTTLSALYYCSYCGEPYIRTRKRPPLGKSNYCDKCRRKGKGKKNIHKQKKREVRNA